MKRFRVLTAALFAAVLLCGFSTTAYAGGGEEFFTITTSNENIFYLVIDR